MNNNDKKLIFFVVNLNNKNQYSFLKKLLFFYSFVPRIKNYFDCRFGQGFRNPKTFVTHFSDGRKWNLQIVVKFNSTLPMFKYISIGDFGEEKLNLALIDTGNQMSLFLNDSKYRMSVRQLLKENKVKC